MIAEIIDLLFAWSAIAFLTQALHLLTGCLSVGVSETRRQLNVLVEEYGYSGWMLFAFSFGFLPRGELELDRGDPA